MKKAMLFVLLFMLNCSDGSKHLADETYYGSDTDVNSCFYTSLEVVIPEVPEKFDVRPLEKYSGDSTCIDLPEPQNGVLELGEGCFKGCLEIYGSLKVAGKGSDRTLIVCDDVLTDAAFSGVDAHLEVSGVSINSFSKGIDLDGESSLKLTDSAVYDCIKGGVSGCIEGESCSSMFTIENSMIADIAQDEESVISYGVTIGPGKLEIKNTVLKNFHSFAVAVWGESELIIEKAVVENVYGKTGDFHGVGIYGYDSDIDVEKLLMKDIATSFIYADVQDCDGKIVKSRDVIMIGSLESEDDQGGLVLNGKVDAKISRLSIQNSRGNGIFASNVNLSAEDIKIDGVTSDVTTLNGFGVVLFDSNAQFERVEITGSEKAGILVDGASKVAVKDINVSRINADSVNGEFGIGIAAQDGASLSIENGIVFQTRECGIMAVDAEIFLNSVEVSDIQVRECFSNGACTFADGVPFGHGISLFSNSSLSFQDVFVSGNANGFNIESSKVKRLGGSVFLIENKSAVNAWNIDDTSNLENAFEDVTFCNNSSIFTTDVQPVREGL